MFFSDSFYSVYAPAQDNADISNVILVDEGFSVTAFIFTGLWALYYRMWWLGAALILVISGLSHLETAHIITKQDSALVQMAFSLWFAFSANDLRVKMLEKKGYQLLDVVVARNTLAAQSRYFERLTFTK